MWGLAIVEDGQVSSPVVTASRREWIEPFTGLSQGQFRKPVRLVADRGGSEIADGRPGRQWTLELPDRVLPLPPIGGRT